MRKTIILLAFIFYYVSSHCQTFNDIKGKELQCADSNVRFIIQDSLIDFVNFNSYHCYFTMVPEQIENQTIRLTITNVDCMSSLIYTVLDSPFPMNTEYFCDLIYNFETDRYIVVLNPAYNWLEAPEPLQILIKETVFYIKM